MTKLQPLIINRFGGLNTAQHPEQIGDTESPDLSNVIIRDGTVRTRPGTSEVGSTTGTDVTKGLFEYRKSDGSVFHVRCQGGKIDYRTTSGAWTNLKSSLSTTAKWSAAVANDLLYLMNGTDTPQRWNGTDAATTAVAAVKNGTTCAYKFDRLIVIGVAADPDAMWFSDPGTPETFGASSYFYAGRKDGGIPLQIVAGPFVVTILKTSGRFEWYGGVGLNDGPRRVSDYGTVGPRSAVVLPSGDVWLVSRQGIRRTNGTTDEAVSDKIIGTLEGLNWNLAADFCAGYFDRYVIFAVAAAGATYPNQWLLCDLAAGGWLLWTLGASCLLPTVGSTGTPILLFGNASGNSKIMQLGDADGAESTFNDLTVAYSAYYTTKQFDCGYQNRQKKFRKLLASFTRQTSAYYATVSCQTDGMALTDYLFQLAPSSVIKYDSGLKYESGIKYADQAKMEGFVQGFTTGWVRTAAFKVGTTVANNPFRLHQLVPHFRVKPSIS
jgi:hypothetical protein